MKSTFSIRRAASVLSAAVLLSGAASAGSAAAHDPGATDRLTEEIARLLPAEPGLPMAPKFCRAKCDAIAAGEFGRAQIMLTEAALKQPIADLSDALYLRYYRPDVKNDGEYGDRRA